MDDEMEETQTTQIQDGMVSVVCVSAWAVSFAVSLLDLPCCVSWARSGANCFEAGIYGYCMEEAFVRVGWIEAYKTLLSEERSLFSEVFMWELLTVQTVPIGIS